MKVAHPAAVQIDGMGTNKKTERLDRRRELRTVKTVKRLRRRLLAWSSSALGRRKVAEGALPNGSKRVGRCMRQDVEAYALTDEESLQHEYRERDVQGFARRKSRKAGASVHVRSQRQRERR